MNYDILGNNEILSFTHEELALVVKCLDEHFMENGGDDVLELADDLRPYAQMVETNNKNVGRPNNKRP